MSQDNIIHDTTILSDPLIRYLLFIIKLKSNILELMKRYSNNLVKINKTLRYHTFGFRINETLKSYGPFIVSSNIVDDDIIVVSFSELFGPYVKYVDKEAFHIMNEGISYNGWLIYSPSLSKNEDGTYDNKYSKQFKENIDILSRKLSNSDDKIMKLLDHIYSKGFTKYKLFYPCNRLFETQLFYKTIAELPLIEKLD